MTQYLLALFREKDITATFFVLGCTAEVFPNLVRQIAAEGHEVATHGYSHTRLFKLTPNQFRDEIQRSVTLLTNIIGKRIIGFRAPAFSLGKETIWALDVLLELGFKYDSSIFSVVDPRYGIGVAGFPRGVIRIRRGSDSIIEISPSTVRWLEMNWPVAFGGYARPLPYLLLRRAVQRVNRDGFPFVMYCHPYELCSESLDCRAIPRPFNRWSAWKEELIANTFRQTMRSKLTRLLNEFKFASIRDILRDVLESC
jgi:polysaccharide deacetylase family protein (PEP-CTERM system associated)